MIEHLRYPVLCISSVDGTMYTFGDMESLTQCTHLGQKWYCDLTVIDSQGWMYHVIGAVPARQSKGLYKLMLPLLNPRIHVYLEFDGGRQKCSLEDLKVLVCGVIDNDVESWESCGDTDALKERIHSAGDYITLMQRVR